jgi:hypothetical protein
MKNKTAQGLGNENLFPKHDSLKVQISMNKLAMSTAILDNFSICL